MISILLPLIFIKCNTHRDNNLTDEDKELLINYIKNDDYNRFNLLYQQEYNTSNDKNKIKCAFEEVINGNTSQPKNNSNLEYRTNYLELLQEIHKKLKNEPNMQLTDYSCAFEAVKDALKIFGIDVSVHQILKNEEKRNPVHIMGQDYLCSAFTKLGLNLMNPKNKEVALYNKGQFFTGNAAYGMEYLVNHSMKKWYNDQKINKIKAEVKSFEDEDKIKEFLNGKSKEKEFNPFLVYEYIGTDNWHAYLVKGCNEDQQFECVNSGEDCFKTKQQIINDSTIDIPLAVRLKCNYFIPTYDLENCGFDKDYICSGFNPLYVEPNGHHTILEISKISKISQENMNSKNNKEKVIDLSTCFKTNFTWGLLNLPFICIPIICNGLYKYFNY